MFFSLLATMHFHSILDLTLLLHIGSKSFDNFIFKSLWKSSEWSFPVSWIPLHNCTRSPNDMFNSAEHLLLVLGYYILQSAPLLNYITLYLFTQLYSEHGSFISFLCCNFIVAYVSFVYNIPGKRMLLKRLTALPRIHLLL